MKIVVIGGVAAGASAAARARRMNDEAEIVIFEKGPYVSFANCGLPYYVGGDIQDRENLLLVSPELFRNRFHIDVRLFHEVTAINRDKKTVTVKCGNDIFEEAYDKLILAPGCKPVSLPLPGAELGQIHTVFTINDVDNIMSVLKDGAKNAVVVGGGFIGLETAEALCHRGLNTTLVEVQDRLMPIFDPEFSTPMVQHIEKSGVKMLLGTSVSEFRGGGCVKEVVLKDGTVLPADIVIMAAGLKPQTELAVAAGLETGVTGGIITDSSMRTNDPDIYAAGDAVESFHRVSGKPIRVSLAANANRQGRIAGNNAAGGSLTYKGTLATSIIRIFDLTAARTGLTEADAKAAGFDCYSVFAPDGSNAGYYPGGNWMILKLTAEKGTGKILGAQCIGGKGVDKRIDVLATSIFSGLNVTDLENLDLAYAPPYASAKGPEVLAGMVASNVLRGDEKVITPAELPEFLEKTGAKLIDVREQDEWDDGYIPGARLIPTNTLRANPELLDKNEKYVIYCGIGKRAHNVCRFLTQMGYDVTNLTGGWNVYAMDV